MTMITYFIAERDLHGYVDDLLDQPRRKMVENYLTRHAALAETVAAYRSQNAALVRLAERKHPMPEQTRALMCELARHLSKSKSKSETVTASEAKRIIVSARR